MNHNFELKETIGGALRLLEIAHPEINLATLYCRVVYAGIERYLETAKAHDADMEGLSADMQAKTLEFIRQTVERLESGNMA